VRPRRADLQLDRHGAADVAHAGRALHDLDANKPGGSIKIRVKTYAHSLRLQQERLEDVARKRRELAHSLDKKRLELLQLKHAQLAGLARKDPELETQINALIERVGGYEAAQSARAELPLGVIQLGRRREDGSIERLGAGKKQPEASAGAEAEPIAAAE
jgi:hypothetical protein